MIHTSMFQKHIHKAKFYPSADDFTALLVMLVTNIMSGATHVFEAPLFPNFQLIQPLALLCGYRAGWTLVRYILHLHHQPQVMAQICSFCRNMQIYRTRSLGALRAPTSSLRPFGPA